MSAWVKMLNRTSNENALIQEELKRTKGNISKVARILGLDYMALRARVQSEQTPQGVYRPALGPEPVDIGALGRPGFQQHVIAVKRAGHEWPDKYDEVIASARKLFDAGTHEMFQTPSNGWVVQYLIPRTRPTRPRRFFATMGAVR